MIIILKGGNSAEREVSLLTAKSISESLTRQKIAFKEVDAADSDWLEKVKETLAETVVIALHGTFGEDGTVQKILENNGIPFTGSSSESSAITFNKVKTKELVQIKTKILVPKDLPEKQIQAFPIIVKPNEQGSSFGVSIVRSMSELQAAIALAQKYSSGDNSIIFEEFIEGVEITCGVIDVFGEITALPLVEIVPNSDFFDYQSKYNSESGCEEVCPARIPEEIALDIQEKSRQIHRLLGLRQYSRMDWILRDDKAYFLEANSLPGMTPTSLLPKELVASGIGYDKFINALVNASTL